MGRNTRAAVLRYGAYGCPEVADFISALQIRQRSQNPGPLQEIIAVAALHKGMPESKQAAVIANPGYSAQCAKADIAAD